MRLASWWPHLQPHGNYRSDFFLSKNIISVSYSITMSGIQLYLILSVTFDIVSAACQNFSSPENFSNLPYLHFKRNDKVPPDQIFCTKDTKHHPHFALTRGRVPYMDLVIGIYRKNQQSQICYFKKVSNGFVDVTTQTGGQLYTIGRCFILLKIAVWCCYSVQNK